MNRTKHSLVAIVGLIILAGVLYLPFVYHNSFGDLDSYRAAIGIADAVTTGNSLEGADLYMKGTSFGYYAFLFMFRPIFEENLALIITVMNYLNVFSAMLIVVPFFLLVKRYWGKTTAIIANILLFFQPAWWNMALYGNPVIQAVLFLFAGLVLIGYRVNLKDSQVNKKWLILLDILIVMAFSLSLVFRLDSVLMFPLITGCLFLERFSIKAAFIRSVNYAIFAALLFVIGKVLLLGINAEESFITVIFRMLQTWHHPSRFFSIYVKAIAIFLLSCHPLFLVAFCIACIHFMYKRYYRVLFFIVPTALINILFWLPNPLPSRHWIYLAPILAIGSAALLMMISEQEVFKKLGRLGSPLSITIIFILVTLASSELLYPIVRVYYPWKCGVQNYSYRAPIRSIFVNKYYAEQYFHNASRLAIDLVELPPQKKPIIVITDPLPTLMKIKVLSKDNKVARIDKLNRTYYEVQNMRNRFIIVTFLGDFVTELLENTDTYNGSYLILDHYNPLTKCFQRFQSLGKDFEVIRPNSTDKEVRTI